MFQDSSNLSDADFMWGNYVLCGTCSCERRVSGEAVLNSVGLSDEDLDRCRSITGHRGSRTPQSIPCFEFVLFCSTFSGQITSLDPK